MGDLITMGSGASTDKKPLTEVRLKSEVGVLFDDKAKRAFDAAATEGPDGTRTVPWPEIEAHAKQHDERALDPRKCLFHNLKGFKVAREQIAEIASKHIKGAVAEIPWVGKDLGDEYRQCGPDGTPAKTLEDLYAIAEVAREEYTKVMTAACIDSAAALTVAGLKGKERAAAKASEEYKDKTAPFVSWLFDVVRGSVLCETEADIVSLYEALESNPDVEIVRVKNRFSPPLFNGYRDILMNVAVKVGPVSHLCELQIHLKAIKDSEPMHKSHLTYEFFRSFFLGNAEAVEERLNLLMALPVDEANDVGELVDRVLGSDADAKLLMSLCALLKSISEFAGVVKVREAILVKKERVFGAESKEVGEALYNLSDAVYDLGHAAKARDLLERALPIYEREYGKDSTKVAGVLHELGGAYMRLGDYTKQRDVSERALPIYEREYGSDHAEVADVLGNLGNAHYHLGDYAKQRNLQERALAIKERTYGRDHAEVATTLTNLGNAYGKLGDHAKKRDILERALAIKERAYGRDHVTVAFTLDSLGVAYGDLGDHAKMRDMQERALAIFEGEYGRDHWTVAITLVNLGEAHVELGAAAEACELLQRALAIHEENFGPDHVYVAYPLRGLGNAHRDLGDAPKSLELLERSLAIFERHYGPENVDVAQTRWGLGKTHVVLGDVAAARSQLERAVGIYEAKWGANHRDTCRCRETLASLS